MKRQNNNIFLKLCLNSEITLWTSTMVLTTNYTTKKPAYDFLFSLQCRCFLRAHKCFCSQKHHVETSRREEEMRRVKESREGAGREKSFFSLSPPPFPSFTLAPTLRVTISTLPNLPLSSKMAATTTRTQRFSPPKIRLHRRLLFVKLLLCKTLKTIHW